MFSNSTLYATNTAPVVPPRDKHSLQHLPLRPRQHNHCRHHPSNRKRLLLHRKSGMVICRVRIPYSTYFESSIHLADSKQLHDWRRRRHNAPGKTLLALRRQMALHRLHHSLPRSVGRVRSSAQYRCRNRGSGVRWCGRNWDVYRCYDFAFCEY